MEKSITEIPKSASRALGAIYMKYQSAGGMTYEVYKKLMSQLLNLYCSIALAFGETENLPKLKV